ncbi:MAG TPA: hypothetical protein VGO70_00565 [Arsenicitalea sp.]|nr:hypothetical protein [Arsenicitalea sp.]
MANETSQAEFLGRLALFLMAFCIVVAGFALIVATSYHPISGTVHVDQAGSSNPAALPTPQTGDKPPPPQPKLDPAPPASAMPIPKQAAPAPPAAK